MPFVDDDFSGFQQSLPLTAGDHPRFNFTIGSGTVMQFVEGVTQDVELAAGNGGGWLAYYIEPTSPNVSVEVKVYISASGLPSTAKMGVFARFVDVNNFVYAVVNCNTGRLEVYEVVGGNTTLLANPTMTAATADIKGASIRIELIGKRLRYWFTPRFFRVEDRPPDGGVDLTVDPDYDDPGEWGIYAESNSAGTNFRAAHFYARELPNVALPPPHVAFANADGLAMTPILASLSGFPTDTLYFDWEVAPADPDDFAEVYRDRSVVSMYERVFWVRPGYTYDVRARAVSNLGALGEWSAPARIVASGEKTSPESPTFPDDVFPDVQPDWVLEHTMTAATDATLSGTQRERTVGTQPRPRRSFTMGFQLRTEAEITQIKNFFDEMQGMTKPWTYTHATTGEQIPMRFAQDTVEFAIVDEGEDGPIFSGSFDVTEAILGGTGDLSSIQIELDSSF